jgi:hypothetical protein
MAETRHLIEEQAAFIMEAQANGLNQGQAASLFEVSSTCIGQIATRMYRDLKISHIGLPRNRAIGMGIAAGLIRRVNIKPPDAPYVVTVSALDSSIQVYSPPKARPFGFKQGTVVPLRGIVPEQDQTITAEERSYLACTLWGMNANQTNEYLAPFFPTIDRNRTPVVLRSVQQKLASVNDSIQTTVSAAVLGVVRINPLILDPSNADCRSLDPAEYADYPVIHESDFIVPAVRIASLNGRHDVWNKGSFTRP